MVAERGRLFRVGWRLCRRSGPPGDTPPADCRTLFAGPAVHDPYALGLDFLDVGHLDDRRLACAIGR